MKRLMPKTRPSLVQVLPYLFIVAAAVGLVASFVLSLDEIQLLKNPGFAPNCNLNPVLSCGSVMEAGQSAVFGFPNSWIGLVTFSVIMTIGVSMLAGAQFKRWFWLALEAGVVGGILFAYWMLFESIYRINALCPYCLSVDVVLTTTFWYLTLHNLGLSFDQLPKGVARITDFARQHHLEILVSWFLIIIAIVLQHFWYYYGQFI